jgi:protein tyrosine phosphatase (PTP) superfamily phosphohydrolase (DUF442 family)
MDSSLSNILNFRLLSPQLATAGQPDIGELLAICKAGYEVVINLGLHEAPYAVPDEANVVTGHGLEYHHLPVDFQAPEVAQFFTFQRLMRRLAGRNCFVHCAANKRVSTFMALYRIIELGWSREDAEADMLEVWKPDAVWLNYMCQVLQRAEQTQR